jgi:integrase
MAKTGRRQKPYQPKCGGTAIAGLCELSNGRWRVTLHGPHFGKRFTEHDERLAIQKFRAMTQADVPMVEMTLATSKADEIGSTYDEPTTPVEVALAASIDSAISPDGTVSFLQRVPESKVWGWVREQLIRRPRYVAQMVGIPEIGQLQHLSFPKDAITLDVIRKTYEQKGTATIKGKRRAIQCWDKMVQMTGAKTLAELTTERLLKYRDEIERTIPGGATKVNYFGRIKGMISFGLKTGLDPVQIRATLDRCRVLWTATKKPAVNPHPISREDFHTLLNAGNGVWRAWLLVGLNCCMHLNEICEIKWTELDLDKAVYRAIRGKTAEQRIPRAATLWPETVAAIKALPRKGPVYLFTSMFGTRYNRNTRGNDFAELRTNAGLPADVKWDDLRDAAYTAAAQGTTDERLARVLAGHKANGLQDHYVLRNAEMVRPACEAVYKAYGPFPAGA